MNWVLNDIKELLVILGLLMVFWLCRSMFLLDRQMLKNYLELKMS